jgi:RNA-directed DNA polymerase
MQGNWKISCTSWSNDQERSAKAINRTADVSRLSKEGQPYAEVGEGRAHAGENVVRSHMPATQSGTRMPQDWTVCEQAASVRKQERFTALLHHVTLNLLRDSFYALKHQASPGADGVTWQEYEAGLESRICDLHSGLHRATYRAHRRDESTYRRLMGGNARRASQHSRTRSFNRLL